ncbi:MAG: hypothetical protein L6R41_003240 [Letrouitia leprolyta]|nr:MAG: hypothetical protein L6R41_003240 [Letrouitia leprolyta]
MCSLLVAILFALSVSARCAPRQASQKQATRNGPGLLSNAKIEDSGVLGSSGSSSSSSTGSSTSPTSSPSPNGGSSSGSGSRNAASKLVSLPASHSNFTSAGTGGCGALKGVCFNGGFQLPMYDKIESATNWITFQLEMPSGEPSERTKAEQVPMMAFAKDVQQAVDLVNGPNAPEWLLTFNEPDFSYMGWTPKMEPEEAAKEIQRLLDKPGTKTKFVAPVTANPDSDWHDRFFVACRCKDFFSAYNIHQYHRTSAEVIDQVTSFHNKWNDKPLWITEVAPGNANCQVSWDEAGAFMKDIYKFAKNSGFIDRVFWNTGNQLSNDDTNVCNSWLLDTQGNPGPLLQMFESVDCT